MDKYLKKLEFDKILEKLSEYAVTDPGKNLCFNLKPSNSNIEVNNRIKETTEACIFLIRKGQLPLAPVDDIKIFLKILKTNGVLSAKSLLSLANILKISRELKKYSISDVDISFSSILIGYFNDLYSNQQIETKIFSSIIDENTIDDRASDTLYKIRQNKHKIETEIRTKLNSFLNSKYIQEPIITIRNNRFVIPVKQEYKSEVKGLLHDTSSSGSTLFIEPLSVFELNNKLNNLALEENIEIEAIISNLSSLFYSLTDELEKNYYIISKIDFAFAKAKYANSIKATEPIINNDKAINLKDARHPLIDENRVVPISIEIGSTYSSLVITGPNTGGKTVTLKTVGLISIMAMCGLYIPTAEKSSVYVFDRVFADIGDDQSILESLSTFSSHITNIVEILKNATSKSLVLLDELGSGTDPVEGSSLAVSILENLSDNNILTIATTHYPEVKNFALTNPKFENASSEFNLEALSPTYRLLIGVPGKSMAFEISKKLGIDSSILENAKNRISKDTIQIEELLKNIYDDKLFIQKEREKIAKYSEEIKETRNDLNKKKEQLFETEASIISDAKTKARNILLDAKQESDEIIKKLTTVSIKEATNLRENLNKKIKNIKPVELPKNNIKTLSKESISENMHVFVTTLNQEGIVLSTPSSSSTVLVQVGSMKMNIPISNLAPSKISNKAVSGKVSTSSKIKEKNISSEINLIGYNVDEAIFVLDKYLDDAKLCSLPTVRIVHGKGSGALRNGIHKFLKTNKHVKSFRLGTFGEGEMGVTIVEIKKQLPF